MPFRNALKEVSGRPLPKVMAARNVPGMAIALVEGNQLVDAVAYGVQDVVSGVPTQVDTVFQAASVSKLVNAVAVLRLVELGKVTLDEDICARIGWAPELQADATAEPITLRKLLRHTAGIRGNGTTPKLDGTLDPDWGGGFGGYHDSTTPLPTTLEILDGDAPATSLTASKNYQSDAQFSYSGPGITLAQYVLEQITATPYATWCAAEVFKPLGMLASTFQIGPPSIFTVTGGLASGHLSDGSLISGLRRSYPESAAAGLYTTVTDMATIVGLLNTCGLHDGERFLATALVEDMMTAFKGSMLGCFPVGPSGFVHTGSNAGFRSLITGYRDSQAGLVVLSNGSAKWICPHVRDAVVDALGWQ